MNQNLTKFKKTLVKRDSVIIASLMVIGIAAIAMVGHTPVITNGSFCVPSGSTYGSDTLKVNAPKTGMYYVWLHLETTEQLNSNLPSSISSPYNPLLIGIDNKNCFALGDGTNLPLNSWVWLNSLSTNPLIPLKVKLSRGIHIISISGVSESFDRLEIIPNNCIPNGDGSNCLSPLASPNL